VSDELADRAANSPMGCMLCALISPSMCQSESAVFRREVPTDCVRELPFSLAAMGHRLRWGVSRTHACLQPGGGGEGVPHIG
jgi:hypothetical protein